MKIETATIRRLRDALLQSGRRPSNVTSSAYEVLTREGLLSGEEQAAVNHVAPLAETMFLVIAADGKIADAEKDAVRGAIRGLTDNLLKDGTINVMLETYEQAMNEHGRDARLRQVAEKLRDEKSDAEGAFTLAAAVALADDEVADSERAFIRDLADWLGITPERARVLVNEVEVDRTGSE